MMVSLYAIGALEFPPLFLMMAFLFPLSNAIDLVLVYCNCRARSVMCLFCCVVSKFRAFIYPPPLRHCRVKDYSDAENVTHTNEKRCVIRKELKSGKI